MRLTRALPLAALVLTLAALPAQALTGDLTLEGVITAVNGNQVALNGGIVVLDVTHAAILGRGDGVASGVASLVAGAPIVATVTGKGADGSLVVSTLLVGAAAGIQLRGALEAVDVDAATIKLLGLTVGTDKRTAFTGATPRGPVRSLADLTAGDEVTVEANRVGGALVALHVDAEFRTPPDDHMVIFFGKVEAIGATTWTISGRTVKVNAATGIHGTPAVGDFVKVKAELADDATLTALSIDKEGRPSPAREIHGTLEVKGVDAWTISGLVVKVTSTTIIRNDPKVGDRVEGFALSGTDGTLTAIVLVGAGTRTGAGNGRH